MVESAARVVAILQARMGSTRLPTKALALIGTQSVLALIVKRVRSARRLTDFVVATTELPDDDPIVREAQSLGMSWFRGADLDCLDRYYQAARRFSADVVVRLTADNPFVDGDLVDSAVEQFFNANPAYDYLDTGAGFPVGLSVEVLTLRALEAAWREDNTPEGREHVTPFLYRHAERFCLGHLTSRNDYSHIRLTLDTMADLARVRRIYDYFGHDGFSWQEVISLKDSKPELLSSRQTDSYEI